MYTHAKPLIILSLTIFLCIFSVLICAGLGSQPKEATTVTHNFEPANPTLVFYNDEPRFSGYIWTDPSKPYNRYLIVPGTGIMRLSD